MDLGVLESQTGGDYFLDKIFVNQCRDYAAPLVPGRLEHLLHLPTGSVGVCGAPQDPRSFRGSLFSSRQTRGSSARPAELPRVIVFPERIMVCTPPPRAGTHHDPFGTKL